MWAKIFNNPEVRRHRKLIELLDECSPDFETAYGSVLENDYSDEEEKAIRAAVESVFSRMDEGLRNITRWGEMPCPHGITKLVCEFTGGDQETGFFFTLNQDLFIERHIVDKTFLGTHGHRQLFPLGISARPGMMGSFLGARPLTRDELKTLPSDDQLPKIKENAERHTRFGYVKLHGSTGWIGAGGSDAMVIGGGKTGRIKKEPLLRWYSDLFERVLLERRHRLLIIGYSFRDPHINEVIAKSLRSPGLDLAVISPQPWSVFDKGLKKQADSAGKDDIDAIRGGLRGSDSRYFQANLIEIFPSNAGGDISEGWREIQGFLRSSVSGPTKRGGNDVPDS